MTIRLILVLTVFALVLGGVGAAFVQAQPSDFGSPAAPDPTRAPSPAKKPEPAKASVKSDARHDDVQSELETVEAKWDDDDQGGDDNSLVSAPSAPSAASVPSAPSAASAASAPSTASAPSAPSAPSAASTDD